MALMKVHIRSRSSSIRPMDLILNILPWKSPSRVKSRRSHHLPPQQPILDTMCTTPPIIIMTLPLQRTLKCLTAAGLSLIAGLGKVWMPLQLSQLLALLSRFIQQLRLKLQATKSSCRTPSLLRAMGQQGPQLSLRQLMLRRRYSRSR